MTASDDPPTGLCAGCAYGQVITSNRGSRFWRCRLSEADARFPKYPHLPVLTCDGFAAPPPALEDRS